jgi:hypothetical protein
MLLQALSGAVVALLRVDLAPQAQDALDGSLLLRVHPAILQKTESGKRK